MRMKDILAERPAYLASPQVSVPPINPWVAAIHTGKERFETPALARLVSDRRNERHGDRPKQVVYKCPICGGYHIGTPKMRTTSFKRGVG